MPRFQGSYEELRGWGFDSTDSGGADKKELKSSIDKLEPITLTTPTMPADEALQIETDIYKEECSRPMHEKIKTIEGFDTITDDIDVIELLKAIKSTVFSKLKEELHNGLAQGRNGYPDTVDQAYTMICERRDQGTPRIKTDPQLAFHADGRDPQDGEEEILPPTEG
eukprot:11480905-Ditylum_brightwellii.AAC.1